VTGCKRIIDKRDWLEGKIESEIKLDKMPKPFSFAMVKMLFGGRE
jgi:hypothetical protein